MAMSFVLEVPQGIARPNILPENVSKIVSVNGFPLVLLEDDMILIFQRFGQITNVWKTQQNLFCIEFSEIESAIDAFLSSGSTLSMESPVLFKGQLVVKFSDAQEISLKPLLPITRESLAVLTRKVEDLTLITEALSVISDWVNKELYHPLNAVQILLLLQKATVTVNHLLEEKKSLQGTLQQVQHKVYLTDREIEEKFNVLEEIYNSRNFNPFTELFNDDNRVCLMHLKQDYEETSEEIGLELARHMVPDFPCSPNCVSRYEKIRMSVEIRDLTYRLRAVTNEFDRTTMENEQEKFFLKRVALEKTNKCGNLEAEITDYRLINAKIQEVAPDKEEIRSSSTNETEAKLLIQISFFLKDVPFGTLRDIQAYLEDNNLFYSTDIIFDLLGRFPSIFKKSEDSCEKIIFSLINTPSVH